LIPGFDVHPLSYESKDLQERIIQRKIGSEVGALAAHQVGPRTARRTSQSRPGESSQFALMPYWIGNDFASGPWRCAHFRAAILLLPNGDA
jgi:hypothetical protein